MSLTNKQLDSFINQLPDSVKQNTNIDELLKKLEKSKDEEKLKIIEQIDKELEQLLKWEMNIELSQQDKEKLEKIKKQIDQFKQNLEDLKKQVWQLPKKDVEKLGAKIFTISENIEENWFDWKDENWIFWFFRNILKWIESLLWFWSSLWKISTTFEKLWYWESKDIEKVLKLIWNIKFKDLKDFYENLKKDKDLKVYIEKIEHHDNPWIPNFIEKYTDKLINWFKDFFRNKIEFENEQQKKIASYIVLTLLLNKDFFEKKEDSWITRFVKDKIGFWQTPEEKVDDMTIDDLLEKMFPHGLSDFLRDYALPAKGVKLINFKNSDSLPNDTENLEEKQIKIGNYIVYFRPKNEVIIEKNWQRYRFLGGKINGKEIKVSDINNIDLQWDEIVIKLSNWKIKKIEKSKIINLLKKLDDSHLNLSGGFSIFGIWVSYDFRFENLNY